MNFIAFTLLFFLSFIYMPAQADNISPASTLPSGISNPFVEAQEKLIHAKGSYRTTVQQKKAMEDMRKAAKLTLRAATLRSKAEKLQNKADLLINKANQQAISRGLLITNPLIPVKAEEQIATDKPSFVPVPGQSINIIAPQRPEEVSLEKSKAPEYLPEPPTINNF